MSRKPSDQLNLRFYEPKRHRSSTVPAAALAQSLDALQRVILLLAMRRDGYTPGRRVRPSANLQHRYRLVCALPTAGSFVAPVQIEGAELLSPAETASLVKEVSNVLAAVGRASEADLEGYLADETWRRFALEAIERLIPDRSSGVELEILSGETSLMDSVKARPFVERVMRSPTRHKAPGVIIGEFKRIDFMKHEITIRHLQSGRDLTGVYNDYVEQSLLDHPRAVLLVYGTITRNAQGRPISIDEIERIEAVDLDPIAVEHFLAENTKIVALEELEARVSFDESDGLFCAEIASLRLTVFAETRDNLTDALADELAVVWKRYAKAPDAKLTSAANVLKQRLLIAFGEAKNAA